MIPNFSDKFLTEIKNNPKKQACADRLVIILQSRADYLKTSGWACLDLDKYGLDMMYSFWQDPVTKEEYREDTACKIQESRDNAELFRSIEEE